MSFTEVAKILDEQKAKHVVLLCHHNADPDAICSAYALSSLIKRLNPQITVEVGAAQSVSRLSKHILKHFPLTVGTEPKIEEADVIILLDTNTVQQLDNLAEKVKASKVPVIVIDHHTAHPETVKMARLCITDENVSSTCEIIYRFYQEANVRIEPLEAKAIFLGIAFDTRHFVLASSTTLKVIAELVDIGINAQEALAMLALPMDYSERVARLKACKRAKLFKVGDWIVALSHVSAYQASAARAMVDLGAHVAVVAGQKDDSLEISLRCTKEFHEKTGIHLGRDIAKPLGDYLRGMGGGHATAAGVNGYGELEAGLKRCWKLLKERIVQTQTQT